MAVARGIFGLYEVVEEKFNNTWTDLAQVWIDQTYDTAYDTGYFGGGSPGPISTMDKVTYASDTTAAVPGANLTVARFLLAATGSSTAGYFGGGAVPSGPNSYSTMDKTTYSSDTTAALPGAALSSVRYNLSATGSSTAGYFGGGSLSSFTVYSTMDKVTYSSDTTAAVPGAALSDVRRNLAATGNSTAGYFGGGNSGPSENFTRMDKLTYSTDTTAAVPGAFLTSIGRRLLAATGNSTAGYFGGGISDLGSHSTMDMTTYSSDTTEAVPGANLSISRTGLAATGNQTAGYFGGNTNFPTSSTMDKLTYSSDTTVAVPTANLSLTRGLLAASSAKANALPQNRWRRFSDGTTTTGSSLPPATPTPQFIPAPNQNFGHYAGGQTGPASITSWMDKIIYSSETITSSTNLTIARPALSGTSSLDNGYFGGGLSASSRV